MKEIRTILYPLALLYGLVVHIRNLAFDWKWLPSARFRVKTIAIGNLSMGGTGKTPHIEYLTRLLMDHYKIAILSRGYKRKTVGFRIATTGDTAESMGDEPIQYFNKFQGILIAVAEQRKLGIEQIMKAAPETEIILLDDAFQHRWVKPGLSILLTDYHKPYYDDQLFPAGSLREHRSGANRADMIVVTKTPKVFSPITRRIMKDKLNPLPNQPVHYSFIKYGEFRAFTPVVSSCVRPSFNTILLFAGVANPYPLEEHLRPYCEELECIYFGDHHEYTTADIARIKETFTNIVSRKKAIVTTEKDIMRLAKPELLAILNELPVFYKPLEIVFHEGSRAVFHKQILDYVAKTT
jgi:tetraacyldisaccharide 4'-kinase